MSKENLDNMFDEAQDPAPESSKDPAPESSKDPAPEDEIDLTVWPYVDEPLDKDVPEKIDKGSHVILINFDGAIHDTAVPWDKREEIKGEAVKGAFEAMKKYHAYGFHIRICSSRAASQAGINAIHKYLTDHKIDRKTLSSCSISDKVISNTVFIGATGFSPIDSYPSINTIMTGIKKS